MTDSIQTINPTSSSPTSQVVDNSSINPDPDYSQFNFETERCNYRTGFAVELTWLQARAKSDRSLSFSSIAVNADGTVSIAGIKYKATKWAFEQLCARLGIPRPFAKKIPPDLLLDNISRLIKEKAQSPNDQIKLHFVKMGTAAIATQEDVLVGCTKDDYMFVEAIDFLTAAASMDGNGYHLENLTVGDRLIEVDLLIDNMIITTPTSKSQFHVGVNLRSSDIGDVNPTARLMLKDITKNITFVLSTEWGRVDRVRNKKVTIETSFTNFMGHVREMIIATKPLEASLERVDQEASTDVELKNWFDTFNRAIDNKEAIDSLLAWTEDARKDMWKQISTRRKDNATNKLQGFPVIADGFSGFKKRDLLTIVAEYAKEAVIDEKEPLRRLAGSFVDLR